MKINKKLFLVFSSMIFILCSCASPNVPLSQKFWQDNTQKVVIASDKISNPGLYKEGSQGFLDILANNIVTSEFNKYLKNYSTESISELPNKFDNELKNRGINASIYGRVVDTEQLYRYHGDNKQFADKDFTPLTYQLGHDKLLLISTHAVGGLRRYYGILPLGAPKALCILEGQLVDLKDNKILWRYTSNVTIEVNGNWDQPPTYPHFSIALKQAISIAEQELLASFFSA